MRKTKRLVTDDSTQNIGGPIIISQEGAYQIMFESEKIGNPGPETEVLPIFVALIKIFDFKTENATLKALVGLK